MERCLCDGGAAPSPGVFSTRKRAPNGQSPNGQGFIAFLQVAGQQPEKSSLLILAGNAGGGGGRELEIVSSVADGK